MRDEWASPNGGRERYGAMTRIKSLRLEAKLSVNQFARLADLDRATVSKAEKGCAVSELTLHKIAGALAGQLGRKLTADDLVSQ